MKFTRYELFLMLCFFSIGLAIATIIYILAHFILKFW